MNDLEAQFNAAFDDKLFTRAERQSLRKLLKEEQLTLHELAVLRSKIFDIARNDVEQMDVLQVIEWLEKANKLVLPEAKKPFHNEAFFSPGDDCLNAIMNRLQSAINKVDICVFTISDDRISREIENCHQRRLQIRIITDNDKAFDRGSDIERLANKGLNIRVDRTEKHMHHKFAIIDGKILLTGSYNWTRSAASYNEENILITDDPQSIRAYQAEFNKLWEKMKVY